MVFVYLNAVGGELLLKLDVSKFCLFLNCFFLDIWWFEVVG